MKKNKIHKTAEIQSSSIGVGNQIWQYSIVLENAIIGNNCNINCHCFIENDVVIGNNVTVKNGVYLWDGITIEDNVFIGPNVTFTNDLYPRSKKYIKPIKTLVKHGASIGANSTILCGIKIGKFSMIGAGSIVTKNIPDFSLFLGNPARFKYWIDSEGNKLLEFKKNKFLSEKTSEKFKLKGSVLHKIT